MDKIEILIKYKNQENNKKLNDDKDIQIESNNTIKNINSNSNNNHKKKAKKKRESINIKSNIINSSAKIENPPIKKNNTKKNQKKI